MIKKNYFQDECEPLCKNDLLEIIQKHKSICWYPSAGSDFRALLYLSKSFYEKHEELSSENAELPDLFIMTDYYASERYDYSADPAVPLCDNFSLLHSAGLMSGDVLFEDDNTTITVKRPERILLSDLGAQTDLVDLSIPSWYGSGYFMTVEIDSHNHNAKKLGKWEADVIYLYAENTAFAKDILIQNEVNIDYIVRVRYGCGFGGSSETDGVWLFYLSDLLNVKYYISSIYDGDDDLEGDIRALKCLQSGSEIKLKHAALTPLFGRNWYKNEFVTWFRVEQ